MGRMPFSLAMVAAVLVGCPSAKEPPAPGPQAPPSLPEGPAPSGTTADTANEAVTCKATLIRREGLGTDGSCLERIAAVEASPPETFACATDADCRIAELAGGCLGVNAGAGAKVELLPASCAAAGCAEATFDDHRIRCDDGCCQIYEE